MRHTGGGGLLAALLAGGTLLAGCTAPQAGQQEADGKPTVLTLAVAASLREVVTEVAGQYSAEHPGQEVRITAAGSGALLSQLQAGAPADLFLSADSATMHRAQAAGLLAGEPRPLVYNRLVLIAPQDTGTLSGNLPSPLPTRPEQAAAWLSAQASAGARIATGQPSSVPAGRYAQEALEGLNVWDALQPRLVYGQSVRQVLDWVARGEAQAGLVYATDAALMPERVQVVAELPLGTPIEYQAAQLRAAPQPQAAAALLDYLGSPAAQSIFRKAGFLTEPAR
ncbi:molybdate ABC transporter substrate-binding protein [Deinococcus piscis]|uniref:Molybdate ABC transporter substrate-binding protein n=1 Tax=Deinococcus piscis TaxID=394230 RepID=A0ABQ3K6E7_9DEIO|nr:molybdate ABC transporter substrate-binding protein [Deinococcus piscis]GHG02923.1 molybdate ABC transporter substrate-binding protein [Deinococcus piscis]